MRNACRIVLVLFIAAYGFALLIGLVGTYGWFGQPTDPLSWLFISSLGLPWVLLVDAIPDGLQVVLAAAAPLINLAILAALCRVLSRGQNGRPTIAGGN